MKLKNVLVNLVVMAVSIAVGLVLAEFVARFVINPADVLKLEVVSDPILGAVPSPSSLAGFDRWGFRNRKVPKTADIVAVGDSHTYGNTARMVDSWPYVLGELTGEQVYNMGLGGYGPNQYFYLSKTKAFELKPKMILWGLYMGDDFENAFSNTYALDYWAYLRKLPPQKVQENIWEVPPNGPSLNKKIRIWLSRHSVIYQLVFHMGLGKRVEGEFTTKNAAQLYPGLATSIVLPDKNIAEAFRPKGVLFGLDQDDPHVREGIRITLELIKEMDDLCKQNHVQFVVVVIPTKETVFADYLEHNASLPLDDVLDKVIANERIARTQLFTFLGDNHIPSIDTLPALRKSVGQHLYFDGATDMHPGKNGYHVIAEAVAEALKQGIGQPQPAAASK